MILALGGVHAGWSLYVKDGKPKLAYNYLGNVTTIFVYDGGKPGSGGTGSIFINGRKVATSRIERTIPFVFGVETADVGEDLYTPVTSDYAKGNNKFTGKIDKVTIDLKKMNSADEDAARKAAAISDEDDADTD